MNPTIALSNKMAMSKKFIIFLILILIVVFGVYFVINKIGTENNALEEQNAIEVWRQFTAANISFGLISESELPFGLAEEEKEKCLAPQSKNCPAGITCQNFYSIICLYQFHQDTSLCNIIKNPEGINICKMQLERNLELCKTTHGKGQGIECFADFTSNSS